MLILGSFGDRQLGKEHALLTMGGSALESWGLSCYELLQPEDRSNYPELDELVGGFQYGEQSSKIFLPAAEGMDPAQYR